MKQRSSSPKTPQTTTNTTTHDPSAGSAGMALAPPVYGLDVVDRQQMDGMQPVALVQAKLTIGAPNDPYEREADRVATQVVQHLHAPTSLPSQQNHPIQQQAARVEEEKIQRKPLLQVQGTAGSLAAPPAVESSIQRLRGAGQPLTAQIREPMEQAFGADFSEVKVHTDAQADQLNRAIQAKAFTTGQDLFFRQGTYAPSSREGQTLLAHELTHVVQQNGEIVQRVTLPQETLNQRPLPQGISARLPKLSNSGQIQRVKIGRNEIEGLNTDFDSDNYEASVQEIDALTDAGNKVALTLLRGILFGKKGENDAKLLRYIEDKQKNGPNVLDKVVMGFLEKWRIGQGFSNQPKIDEAVKKGLNMWVVGDTERGVNWQMIGSHLRGRLKDKDYELIGRLTIMKTNQREPEQAKLIELGRQVMESVRGDIRAALDKLPDFRGHSYRISGVEDMSVYTSKIKKGDLIKDTTFWSTAAVRGASGAAGDWGKAGTEAKPKAYFIIDGSSGKYIAKYSKVEGEREVLFKDHTIFEVDRIVKLDNTFYVYIREVGNVPQSTTVKNYYNGKPYTEDEPSAKSSVEPNMPLGTSKKSDNVWATEEMPEQQVPVTLVNPQHIEDINQRANGIYMKGNSTINSRGQLTQFVEVGFYEQQYRQDGIPLDQQRILQGLMKQALKSSFYVGQTSNAETQMVLSVDLNNVDAANQLYTALVEKLSS